MHAELRDRAQFLDLQPRSVYEFLKVGQAGFGIDGVHRLELAIEVGNHDICLAGLLKDNPNCLYGEGRHVDGDREHAIAAGMMQSRIQSPQCCPSGNHIFHHADSQRLKWLLLICDNHDLLEEDLVNVQDPLQTTLSAEYQEPLILPEPPALPARHDQPCHCMLLRRLFPIAPISTNKKGGGTCPPPFIWRNLDEPAYSFGIRFLLARRRRIHPSAMI